jgi:sugar phosphate isomerase/epimerase
LDLLRESIDLAAALGAQLAVMHPGRRTVPGDAFDDYWPLLTEGLSDLAQYASERGVRLAVEHMEPLPNEFVVGPEAMQRLFAEVNHPNLALAFDLAHVPWGVDPVDYYQQMPPVGHLHLSDAAADGRHLALGEGAHDLVRFLSHLTAHYEGAIVVEGIEHRRTKALAARNKQAWDQLAGMFS